MNHFFKEMFIKNVSFVYSYHYYQFEKIIKIDNIVYIVEYFRLYITIGCSGKIVFFLQFTATPPSPTSLL